MTRRISESTSAGAPEPALPLPGEIVADKYRIERTLGMGGMGAVFEVTHCVTHKRFAIKWLLAAATESEEAAKRFIREAQIAGRIKHPNVVEVYDIYQQPSGVFLVMELLEGESLDARLARQTRLGVSEAVRIALGSMEGVAAAHAAGVVHRDIKPANIFLCRGRGGEVQPKVVDFGVSRLSSLPGFSDLTTTRSGTVFGTPHYMAPEQMRAEPVDGRTDVYALGITLYQVLAGSRPYDAATYPELVLKIAAGAAVPLAARLPDLPEGLAAIVSRAMDPEPSARFPSVEAFMRALEPYAGTTPDTVPSARPNDSASTPTLAAEPRAVRAGIRPRWLGKAGGLGLAMLLLAWLVFLARTADESRVDAATDPQQPLQRPRESAAPEPAREPEPPHTPRDDPPPEATRARAVESDAPAQPATEAPAPSVVRKPRGDRPARAVRVEPAQSGAPVSAPAAAQPELDPQPSAAEPPSSEQPPAAPPTRRERPTVRLDRGGF
jgi:eukaryotic-like serine/threonine-protein kinase